MEERAVKTLTEKTMYDHGLIQKGWKFRYGRGKKRFGCCDYDKKEISISRPLSNLNDEKKVMDIILHEIAHALVGYGHGHDKVWRRKCIEIGGDGKRCYSLETTNTFKDYGDCILTSKKINNVIYKRGDSIRVRSRRYGNVIGTFKEYVPRNHRYPVIIEIHGRDYKFGEEHVIPLNESNKVNEPNKVNEDMKYAINKRYLMIQLEGEINTWKAKERKAIDTENYAEAIECQAKAEIIQSIIARHLV